MKYKEGVYIDNNVILTQKLICEKCFCETKSKEEYKKYLDIEDYIGDNFYCPQCNQLILGENNNLFNTKYINHIPLYLYVNILRERFYDTKYIIKYTKEIYNIELTEKEIRNNGCESVYLNIIDENVFDEFRKENSINVEEDDYSRKYFNNQARTQYLNFLQYIKTKYINDFSKNYMKKCFGISLRKSSEVHHVHPLMYGGNNQLENLLAISGWTHRLLHNNSLEKHKIYCFQALDYLNYIGNYCFFYYMDKNNIFNKSNNVPEIAGRMMSNVFEEEMFLYYHELKINNKTVK